MSNDRDISINDFIFKFKTTQGKPFTHTSISKPRHSYYINSDRNNYKKFISFYKKAFIQGIPLSLCEKHMEQAPILIDLDFEKITSSVRKYDKSDDLIPESKSFTKHIYKINSIETFIKLYIEELIPYIDTKDLRYVDIYVQEKQYAVNIVTHKIDNGQKQITTKIKDGVHIIIPDIVTCPELQFILRNKFIEKYGNIFNKYGFSKKMNDIFDEAVIKRNNWLMYGSSKRLDDYDQVYYVTNIYKYDIYDEKLYKIQNDELFHVDYKFHLKNGVNRENENGMKKDKKQKDRKENDKDDSDSNYEANDVELSSTPSEEDNESDEVKARNLEKFKEQSFRKKHVHFIELFSIRNKFKEIEYNLDKYNEILEYKKKITEIANKKILGTKPQVSEFEEGIVSLDLEYIKNLIRILSPERASSYQTWVDVCWCLRNIDYRTYDDFLEFSKKTTSGNFDEAACFKLWSSPKKDGFGLGSLVHWAKQDNFKAYQRIIGQKIFKQFNNENEIADDDHSIAKVIHNYLGPIFIAYYENSGKVKWFEFKNHRWHPDNGNASLSMIMSEEVVNLYKQYGTKFYEDDNHNMADLCKKIIRMLKNSPTKSRFIKELGSFYSDATNKLVHKFDTNTMLFGFENGVFDFNSESFGFRDGRPDDNMTYSSGYDYRYIPFDEYEYENNDHNHEYNEDQQIISEIMDFFDKVFPIRAVRDYMLMSFAECLTGETSEVFYICQGCGCHAIDSGIMMYDGSIKKVQDIVVGDKLIGNDKTIRNVLKLHRGRETMYKVKPSNGSPEFIVNESHKLVFKLKENGSGTPYQIGHTVKYCEKILETEEEGLIALKFNIADFNSEEDAEKFLEEIRHNSNILNAGDIVSIMISNYIMNDISGFGLQLCQIDANTRDEKYVGFKLEKLDVDDYYGFEVDENHLYLDEFGYIQSNSNGKSLIINVMQEVFGKYIVSLPIQNLLGKRVGAGSANSEIVDTKGARLVVASEPEENEKLSSGFVKELTGGDPIKARALYSDPIEFKPQFKLFMMVNHLPTITDDSEGIWRRVKVIDFISQFKENPDDTEKYHFHIDRSLKERVKKWKVHLFNILVYYYKKLKKYGKKIPKEIEKANSEYKKNNNVFANYQSDILIKTNDNKDILYLDDLYTEYNSWFKKYNTGHFAKLHKPDFIKTVEKVFGHISGKNGVSGGHIKGWKFKKDTEMPRKLSDDDSDIYDSDNDIDNNKDDIFSNNEEDEDYTIINKANSLIDITNSMDNINKIVNIYDKDENDDDNKVNEEDTKGSKELSEEELSEEELSEEELSEEELSDEELSDEDTEEELSEESENDDNDDVELSDNEEN